MSYMQDINLNLIRYFVTLVECGQFVKAAKKISISQPALSKSIKLLEDQLGTPLLKRTKRTFSLTDNGKYFYESSRHFLRLYDDYLFDVRARAHSPYSGLVRVGLPSSMLDAFFPELIMELNKIYPGIRISTLEESSSQAILSLQEGKIDFSFARSAAASVSAQPLCVTPLLDSTYHIVFPADHPFAEKDVITIELLEDEKLMLPSENSIIRKELNNLVKFMGFHLNVVFASGQLHILLDLVRRGLGITVLPGILLNDNDSTLQHRPLVPDMPWDMALIYPEDCFMSLSTKCALDFMRDYFKRKNLVSPNKGGTAADF